MRTPMEVRPDLRQQRDFLFQAYFGRDGDVIDRIISRAYRDMNRRLPLGKRNQPEKKKIYGDATELVKSCLHRLLERKVPADERTLASAFDQWHSDACNQLRRYYNQPEMGVACTYGHAQKWINMTLKYFWYFPEADLPPELTPWFPVAHIPVDKLILNAVVAKGVVARPPCRIWSGWNSEKEYQDFQTNIRNHAASKSTIPLMLESQWWSK